MVKDKKTKITKSGKLYMKLAADTKSKNETANYTFRFNKQLMAQFKKACEKKNLNMTDVVLEVIKDVVKTNE